MSTIQLKCTKTHCNLAKANAKIGQGVKFVMLLAVKQVVSQMQTLSLNSIIENSGRIGSQMQKQMQTLSMNEPLHFFLWIS